MYRRGNLIFCLEVRPITEFSKEFISHSGKDFVICLDNNLENLVDFSSFPATHLEKQSENRSRVFGNIGKRPKPNCAALFSQQSIIPKYQITTE
jgi:hypothetical protein